MGAVAVTHHTEQRTNITLTEGRKRQGPTVGFLLGKGNRAAKATAPNKILGQSGESKAVNRRQVRREPARERDPSPTPLSMQRGGGLHSNATENLSEGP